MALNNVCIFFGIFGIFWRFTTDNLCIFFCASGHCSPSRPPISCTIPYRGVFNYHKVATIISFNLHTTIHTTILPPQPSCPTPTVLPHPNRPAAPHSSRRTPFVLPHPHSSSHICPPTYVFPEYSTPNKDKGFTRKSWRVIKDLPPKLTSTTNRKF